MIKIVWAFTLLISTAFASFNDMDIVNFGNLNEKEGITILRERFEDTQYLARTQTIALEKSNITKKSSKAKLSNPYENGDYVILWGVGSSSNDQKITQTEYEGIWRIINYLAEKKFRVIMNVRSTNKELAEALSSKTASVVLYSSHGNTSHFYDFNANPIPTDIFKYRSDNVYQFVLSACYGTLAMRNYEVPYDLKVFSWSGLTNPTELLNFLVSNSYSGFEGKRN